jgi:type I restriction enzyme S subunit
MKPYPKYKDSGVEWIGEVPERWEVKKIKHSTSVKGRVGWHGLNSNNFINDGPFLVTGTDFSNGKIDWKTCYHVSMENYKKDSYIQLAENDLLITKDGSIGKVAIVKGLEGQATLNSGIFVTKPLNHQYITTYLYWILNSSVFLCFIDYNKTGSTVLHLYQDTFENFSFPIPPIQEQKRVCYYLDHKTTQIDNLISKKQKLIELLKEERAAIINQAVTKGLNPDAPMKDSGIEWLGDIPAHWEVKKLKYVSIIISKGTTPSTIGKDITARGEIRFIKAENIENNYLKPKPAFFVDEKTNDILKRSQLEKYDILFVIAGATIGKVAVLTDEFLPANTNQAISFIRLKPYVNVKFIWYWLQSSRINELTWLNAVQSAQPNLSMENLGNFCVTYPTGSQQDEIVFQIESETTKTDQTITKIKKQIDLLKEYRIALISNVVTGKIDVRT